jgi:peroxiredoxin Q/BCP
MAREGVVVAGVSPDSLASHRAAVERQRLPFPLLSDDASQAARELGLVHRVGVAGWNLELFRRSTILIDAEGLIAAVWGRVKIRGHANEVLDAARGLRSTT